MPTTQLGLGQKEQGNSVALQLQHLGGEIDSMEETLGRLSEKLNPLLPPPSPETANGSGDTVNQLSPMMEIVTNMTGRVRGICRSMVHITQEIQI